MNKETRTGNRKVFENSVQKWLFGARDREGGRTERMKRTPAAAEPEQEQIE